MEGITSGGILFWIVLYQRFLPAQNQPNRYKKSHLLYEDGFFYLFLKT